MLKSGGRYTFDEFELDREQRTLTRAGEPLDLNARYFDALALMVEHPGQLLAKDRFMDEVWRGIPVTDEALTQCVRTLRRLLGDDAARPRFIETVPTHGYRFVAQVQEAAAAAPAPIPASRIAVLTGAGTIGGGIAGLIGGGLYGIAAASNAAGQDVGGVSILLVLMCVTIATAVVGAAGVSLGIAIGSIIERSRAAALIGGGALGGLIVKLILLDAFRILFGQSPGDISGAIEGLILGAAVGLGAWIAVGRSLRRATALAAACGAAGGLVIALLGRPLMAGSLARLAEHLPSSRLSLDPLAACVGETQFGPVASAATATLEGALFAGAIVLAMRLAERGS